MMQTKKLITIVNRQLILIVLFMTLIITASASADNATVHVTYVSFVDPVLGFYRVLDETTHQPSNYVDHILTINQGDTVIWKNDADTPNTAIAIVSEQDLFPDAILDTNTAVFPYVFDEGGKYTFHVGEHTTSTQTIMVRSVDTPVPTENTPAPTQNVPLAFVNSDPSDNTINNSVNDTMVFNITVNKPADITWSLDNKDVQFNQSVSTSSYDVKTSVVGMSIVDVTAKTADSSISKEWKLITGTPTVAEDTITPTPTSTVINDENQTKTYSPIQIMGVVIIILSIYITYRTGKEKK
jgi:hypothetical protein